MNLNLALLYYSLMGACNRFLFRYHFGWISLVSEKTIRDDITADNGSPLKSKAYSDAHLIAWSPKITTEAEKTHKYPENLLLPTRADLTQKHETTSKRTVSSKSSRAADVFCLSASTVQPPVDAIISKCQTRSQLIGRWINCSIAIIHKSSAEGIVITLLDKYETLLAHLLGR